MSSQLLLCVLHSKFVLKAKLRIFVVVINKIAGVMTAE